MAGEWLTPCLRHEHAEAVLLDEIVQLACVRFGKRRRDVHEGHFLEWASDWDPHGLVLGYFHPGRTPAAGRKFVGGIPSLCSQELLLSYVRTESSEKTTPSVRAGLIR